MKPVDPPYPYCWVQTKWGRHKAKSLMEFLTISGPDHGKTFLLVKFIDKRFNKLTEEERTFEIKYIDYVNDF